MNSLPRVVLGVLAAACCFSSVVALAQSYDSTAPLTRAQVSADLNEWRQAGYGTADDGLYPQSTQRVGAIVAHRRAAARAAAGQATQ